MKASIKCPAFKRKTKGAIKAKEDGRRERDNCAFCICGTPKADILTLNSQIMTRKWLD